MSFGWSAGDIATAITLAYNLIQALDTCDGAAGDYREAVGFLGDLKRTLEPLQTFSACNANPIYGRDIKEQVRHIREPVEAFLAAVLKYEPSLGARAQEGHHRHILRKLQWYIFMSKKVLGLRIKIESHMRIIDTLMQRLTLDAVYATQQQLPNSLRAALQQTLRPELIAVLQESLPPLNSTLIEDLQRLHATDRDIIKGKWNEHYKNVSAGIQEIKEDIKSSKMTQMRIELCLRGEIPRSRQNSLPRVEQSEPEDKGNEESIKYGSKPEVSHLSSKMVHESLVEVYYLVLLYLGHFLQNLFLVLSRLVQPTRALMPVLLAQYNISFLDAIGRPPRILPFEYFRSFKVLQAFIQYEFKELPGSALVERGRYLVFSLASNRSLDESNWNLNVAPGSTIAMSMVIRKLLDSANSDKDRCPEPSCSGTWTKSATKSWVTCPVCQKQVMKLPPSADKDPVQESNNDIILKTPLEHKQHSEIPNPARPISPIPPPKVDTEDIGPEPDEDISLFVRIVREINDLQRKPSNPTLRSIESIESVQSTFNTLHAMFDFTTLRSLGQGVFPSEVETLHAGVVEEMLAFEGTAERFLALEGTIDRKSSWADFLDRMQKVTLGGRFSSKIDLYHHAAITKSILSIQQIMGGIRSLFPQLVKDAFAFGPNPAGAIDVSEIDLENFKIRVGLHGTNLLATFNRANRNFEEIVASAESSLRSGVPSKSEWPESFPDSYSDSSDGEGAKEVGGTRKPRVRNEDLNNWADLQAAIGMIEHHRESSSIFTVEEVLPASLKIIAEEHATDDSETSDTERDKDDSQTRHSSFSAATWQERLEEKCREAQIHPPVFKIISDRRGGRTVWSSYVTVQGQNIPARFWCDGQHVNNAKEDAAKVALNHLNGSTPISPELEQLIRKESGELIRPALGPLRRRRTFQSDIVIY